MEGSVPAHNATNRHFSANMNLSNMNQSKQCVSSGAKVPHAAGPSYAAMNRCSTKTLFPQGLKPHIFWNSTARLKAVPFQTTYEISSCIKESL
jgi:hypothetical protein